MPGSRDRARSSRAPEPPVRALRRSDRGSRAGCRADPALPPRSTGLAWPAASAGPSAEGGEEGGCDVEQVADHDEVGELGDRRVGVAIDGHDRAGRLHPDLVLDRAGDPEREIERGLDDLAGLADLLGVRDPARVDRGPGRADGATELGRELLDDLEPVRATDTTSAGDDDPSLLDRGGDAGGLDPIDDLDEGQRELSLDRGGSDRAAARTPGRV